MRALLALVLVGCVPQDEEGTEPLQEVRIEYTIEDGRSSEEDWEVVYGVHNVDGEQQTGFRFEEGAAGDDSLALNFEGLPEVGTYAFGGPEQLTASLSLGGPGGGDLFSDTGGSLVFERVESIGPDEDSVFSIDRLAVEGTVSLEMGEITGEVGEPPLNLTLDAEFTGLIEIISL